MPLRPHQLPEEPCQLNSWQTHSLSRPSSSAIVGPGGTSTSWRSRSRGTSTGSTIVDFTARSGWSLGLSTRRPVIVTTPCRRPPRRHLRASSKPRAIHRRVRAGRAAGPRLAFRHSARGSAQTHPGRSRGPPRAPLGSGRPAVPAGCEMTMTRRADSPGEPDSPRRRSAVAARARLVRRRPQGCGIPARGYDKKMNLRKDL